MTPVPTLPVEPCQPAATLSICVFCGARSGAAEDVAAAREIGTLLGRAGHRLIYGGGGSGLMGEVAWAAYDSGAAVTGITPTFLYERERGNAAPPQTLYLTRTMATRKERMLACADAFLALPGGYGTLDEILEVLSLNYLGLNAKPLVLLDVGQRWRSLLRLTTDIVRNGFAAPQTDALFQAVDTPSAAIKTIEAVTPSRSAFASPVFEPEPERVAR
jgi:cytokinin riboside 5'-monophosphate phosphoribohydrolase